MNRNFWIAVFLGVATFGLGAFVSWLRPPVANIQDEFSYLLAADTFSSGRLTNPTHPMWRHLETMHVIHQPSYASKYPPGQGVVLALGQWLTGQPIVGVWLSSALAVVAGYWMLLGMMPRKWALCGALVLMLHPGVQLGWGQCFWGGTLAFAGGCMVLGAALRLITHVRALDSLGMACGAMLLAVTRPFEGCVFCLLIGCWLLLNWIRRGLPPWRQLVTRFVLPQLAVFIVGAMALATYNEAVTGSATTMPYQVHEDAYSICPLFLWQALDTSKTLAHDSMAMLHDGWSIEWYHQQQTYSGFWQTKWGFLLVTFYTLLPLPIALPMLMSPWWRSEKLRGPLLLLSGTWLITQMTIWNYPHYLAPAAPVFLVLIVFSLRYLEVITRHWRLALRPVTAVLALQLVMFGYHVVVRTTATTELWHFDRQAMVDELEQMPGQHLVLVRYAPTHDPLQEWIYNEANIDQSKIVWARPMEPQREQELLAYFNDRQVWIVDADADQRELVAYPTQAPRKLAAN